MTDKYVHGYAVHEAKRLHDQAGSVRDLFHRDTRYPSGSLVLEAACGVGAQTITLARNSPEASFTSLDINAASLERAHTLQVEEKLRNVWLCRADLSMLPFDDDCFDHVWVSHLLEHCRDPVDMLTRLLRVLRPNGSMTVVEGDHGSCYFYPESRAALQTWRCLIKVQASLDGNSLVGRQLFDLVTSAGFRDVSVSPRMIYVDQSTPNLMDSFVERTIIPMVEGVRERALAWNLIDESIWSAGIYDLHEVARREDGVFCYTFFKGTANK